MSMLDFNSNHRKLVGTALFGFVVLSLFIAVIPAFTMQDIRPLPGQKDLTAKEKKGLETYVSENCASCHTQQVRNIEMDKMWGDRPSMPSDYYYSKVRMDFWRQTPSMLGSERTGPDLTNVGVRQPGVDWHLLHLYNPRIVSEQSIMPGYPWLFEEKDSTKISKSDLVVPVPDKYLSKGSNKIVASQKVLNLVAYLQSLKQPALPESTSPAFIKSIKKEESAFADASVKGDVKLPDGEKLYMQKCAACHQANGKGLQGAFPPLAGSPVVNDENYELLVKIILQGYDARAEYGVMPSFAAQLTDEDIAAIATHERSSWGNTASAVTVEDVRKLREFVAQLDKQ